MQTDSNKDFDLLIRSMMENAQEEVPSRVWNSVSSRLDAAAARRRRVVVLRWAGAVASAAAAIAVGVFLLGGKPGAEAPKAALVAESQEEMMTTLPETLSSENGQDATFAVVEKETTSSAIAQVLPSRPTAKAPVQMSDTGKETAVGIAEETEVILPQEEEVTELVVDSIIPEEEVRTAISQPINSAQDKETAFVDPFAMMEWEDSHSDSGRGLSISLGGDVQSNGSPSPTAGFNPRLAPGAAPTESSVQEVSKESNYSIPYSVGLGVRIGLSPKWSIGTGINYSRLQRTFNGIYTEVNKGEIVRKVNADIHNTLHYVGVPVNIYYTFFSNDRLGFYSYAGGTIEKAVANKYRIPASPSDAHFHQSVDGVQFSATAGIGLQFRIAGGLNLYFDPSLRYYFDCGQPTSIRTQMPLLMNLEAGFRFDIK